jgi:3-deoxy-D-manno-octulosonate 8-phosphate phosphatase (KDO 8-P phosphatase)
LSISISPHVAKKIANIKAVVTDVDGVLTDAGLYIDENGHEPFLKFNIQDGYGVIIAHECKLAIIVISGRKSLCTEARCKSLGIEHYYTGIKDKYAKLVEIATLLQLKLEEIAYIGDDLIDLKAMRNSGFICAPKNARAVVKNYADYVTVANGGDGAFREIIDLILETQGVYADCLQKYL